MAQLLIRADASPEIGTGHVMRCLALAQAWQDKGGQATVAMALAAPSIQARLEAEGLGIKRITAQVGSAEDAAQVIQIARQLQAAWVVIDGYRFTGSYQQALKDAGLGLVCIDDEATAEHYYADVILNQNLHADAGLYAKREGYTRLLLGTRYALLRREFRRWQGNRIYNRQWRGGYS